MNPFIIMMLLSSLGLGTALTFSSSHWLLAWMGLEINTLAVMPLMIQQHHPRAVEATTKYFLTQATAAAMILFASIINAWMLGEWSTQQLSSPFATNIAFMALALKIGLAPIHFWLPEVVQGQTLVIGLLISTWQKLAPFALIIQITPYVNSTLLIFLGLSSTLVGGWGGLNQTQLRKILAYSSIAHLGWMIIIIKFAPSLTLLTLTIYIMMTTSAFLTFNFLRSTSITTLAMTWTKSPVLTTLASLMLLSLGGLPPLTGFMPKWMILQELTKQGVPLTATLAALTALLSLYFYLRLCYAMSLTISPSTTTMTASWRLPTPQPSLMLALMMVITLFLLPITPATMTLFSF
uniref:NADH-ubiquinone oxidoreductase chain 2 n=1 Tax=Galaxiella nigrostriata TaxID=89574 RepID=Q08G48_GALNG|nr:NADH dehydrogenase subunit 2 [Galaxiella nigrostriata]BAF34217.1 NADH dehydrogenase subunit 2 [Galaxiella nigrostriata]